MVNVSALVRWLSMRGRAFSMPFSSRTFFAGAEKLPFFLAFTLMSWWFRIEPEVEIVAFWAKFGPTLVSACVGRVRAVAASLFLRFLRKIKITRLSKTKPAHMKNIQIAMGEIELPAKFSF